MGSPKEEPSIRVIKMGYRNGAVRRSLVVSAASLWVYLSALFVALFRAVHKLFFRYEEIEDPARNLVEKQGTLSSSGVSASMGAAEAEPGSVESSVSDGRESPKLFLSFKFPTFEEFARDNNRVDNSSESVVPGESSADEEVLRCSAHELSSDGNLVQKVEILAEEVPIEEHDYHDSAEKVAEPATEEELLKELKSHLIFDKVSTEQFQFQVLSEKDLLVSDSDTDSMSSSHDDSFMSRLLDSNSDGFFSNEDSEEDIGLNHMPDVEKDDNLKEELRMLEESVKDIPLNEESEQKKEEEEKEVAPDSGSRSSENSASNSSENSPELENEDSKLEAEWEHQDLKEELRKLEESVKDIPLNEESEQKKEEEEKEVAPNSGNRSSENSASNSSENSPELENEDSKLEAEWEHQDLKEELRKLEESVKDIPLNEESEQKKEEEEKEVAPNSGNRSSENSASNSSENSPELENEDSKLEAEWEHQDLKEELRKLEESVKDIPLNEESEQKKEEEEKEVAPDRGNHSSENSASNSQENSPELENEDSKLEAEWEHQELIEQLRMEIRKVKATGLPTIAEDSESPSIINDLKPWRIEEKPHKGDRISELHKVYKSYRERMRKFDILNYQKMYALGFLRSKDPFKSISSQKSSAPSMASVISQTLRLCRENKKSEEGPMVDFARELHGDLETVYVGQLCLSWEFLHWQYEKALELWEADPYNLRRYNEVANEFQQLQVLMQRFLENEEFEGPRVQYYVKSRCFLRNLLQVPVIREDNLKVKKKIRTEGKSEFSVSSDMLVEILEESIRIFWRFIRADREANIQKGRKSGHPELQDPVDSELFSNVQATLQQKEKRLKEVLKGGNCILRKFQKRHHDQEDGSSSDQVLAFFSQVDTKLVRRVLNMSRLSTDQLTWCSSKLDRINFIHRRIHVEPSFLLFPC